MPSGQQLPAFRFVDATGASWTFYAADEAHATRMASAWGKRHGLQLEPESEEQ